MLFWSVLEMEVWQAGLIRRKCGVQVGRSVLLVLCGSHGLSVGGQQVKKE
jgi:hypothetical protein